MPTPRRQPRFDLTRGDRPPTPDEMTDLVDPTWILKALGLMLLIGLICALATTYYFHRYQARHACVPTSTQTCTAPKPAPNTEPSSPQ